jgi:rhodanese-related sulfurtransferase
MKNDKKEDLIKTSIIPYLIQRAKFENRDYKTGIDSILYFDYMGSSEFEWGALPTSLKRIRAEESEYTYLDIPIKGVDKKDKVITVFCKNSQKTEIGAYLERLATNSAQLKEYSDFNTYINPSYSKNSTDFWWDIDNDIMFWKKNPEFEVKFKGLITKTNNKI